MHEHFDAQRAFGHVEALSAWRRLAGTPGEAAAQEYIRGAGREIGVEMRDEEFSYSELPLKVAIPATCLVIGAISVMASLAYLWGSSLVIIPGVALLLTVFIGFRWSGTFERFASRGKMRSINLVGEIEGRDPKGTVLLSAHYDSKSQLMPVVLRAGLFMAGYFSAILFGITLVVVGIMAAAGRDYLGSRAGFYVSLVPPVLLLGLIFNVTGNRSPGALDDASGIAVILEVARGAAVNPPENYNLRIAAFGCEEIGLCGSIGYLRAHQEELRKAPFFMLNYDMPFSSSGNIIVNSGFELPPVRTSRKLYGMIRDACDEMGFKLSRVFLPVGAGADHMPWVKHGFEATCLVSAATSIHSARDSLDKVNREGLRRAGEVTLAVLRSLDQDATSWSKNVLPCDDPSSPSLDGPCGA
ncbi:MAG: M28 family metallopeptidase [Candidatus Geothermincolia bacterium]